MIFLEVCRRVTRDEWLLPFFLFSDIKSILICYNSAFKRKKEKEPYIEAVKYKYKKIKSKKCSSKTYNRILSSMENDSQ